MKEEEVEVFQYDGLPAPFINFATLNGNFSGSWIGGSDAIS
jgi:hypothetical protein